MSQEQPSQSLLPSADEQSWRGYLEQVTRDGLFDTNTEVYIAALNRLYKKLFTVRTEVYVTDSTADANHVAQPAVPRCLDSDVEVKALAYDRQTPFRLISFVRGNSLQPLRVSSQAMAHILRTHSVGTAFLDLILGFRAKSELSEKGCSIWMASKDGRGIHEVCYQLRYMEENKHEEGTHPWSERQIGVYHRVSNDNTTPSLLLMLHAKRFTTARTRMEEAMQEARIGHDRFGKGGPLRAHVLVLTSYLDNWRWYLDDIGIYLLHAENKGMTEELNTDGSLTFKTLQSLRNKEAEITTASVVLDSTIDLIENLIALGLNCQQSGVEYVALPHYQEDIQALQRCAMKCRGYSRSVQTLQNRANKLIQLLADGLNHKNQTYLYELTKKSIDDNAVIRVITIITLIYLPTQFVASFFGMNFTDYTSGSIVFTKNWWIFLATAIPLTVLTLGTVFAAMYIEKSKRGNNQGSATQTTSSTSMHVVSITEKHIDKQDVMGA